MPLGLRQERSRSTWGGLQQLEAGQPHKRLSKSKTKVLTGSFSQDGDASRQECILSHFLPQHLLVRDSAIGHGRRKSQTGGSDHRKLGSLVWKQWRGKRWWPTEAGVEQRWRHPHTGSQLHRRAALSGQALQGGLSPRTWFKEFQKTALCSPLRASGKGRCSFQAPVGSASPHSQPRQCSICFSSAFQRVAPTQGMSVKCPCPSGALVKPSPPEPAEGPSTPWPT